MQKQLSFIEKYQEIMKIQNKPISKLNSKGLTKILFKIEKKSIEKHEPIEKISK
jgi:hypothetical protein